MKDLKSFIPSTDPSVAFVFVKPFHPFLKSHISPSIQVPKVHRMQFIAIIILYRCEEVVLVKNLAIMHKYNSKYAEQYRILSCLKE